MMRGATLVAIIASVVTLAACGEPTNNEEAATPSTQVLDDGLTADQPLPEYEASTTVVPSTTTVTQPAKTEFEAGDVVISASDVVSTAAPDCESNTFKAIAGDLEFLDCDLGGVAVYDHATQQLLNVYEVDRLETGDLVSVFPTQVHETADGELKLTQLVVFDIDDQVRPVTRSFRYDVYDALTGAIHSQTILIEGVDPISSAVAAGTNGVVVFTGTEGELGVTGSLHTFRDGAQTARAPVDARSSIDLLYTNDNDVLSVISRGIVSIGEGGGTPFYEAIDVDSLTPLTPDLLRWGSISGPDGGEEETLPDSLSERGARLYTASLDYRLSSHHRLVSIYGRGNANVIYDRSSGAVLAEANFQAYKLAAATTDFAFFLINHDDAFTDGISMFSSVTGQEVWSTERNVTAMSIDDYVVLTVDDIGNGAEGYALLDPATGDELTRTATYNFGISDNWYLATDRNGNLHLVRR